MMTSFSEVIQDDKFHLTVAEGEAVFSLLELVATFGVADGEALIVGDGISVGAIVTSAVGDGAVVLTELV